MKKMDFIMRFNKNIVAKGYFEFEEDKPLPVDSIFTTCIKKGSRIIQNPQTMDSSGERTKKESEKFAKKRRELIEEGKISSDCSRFKEDCFFDSLHAAGVIFFGREINTGDEIKVISDNGKELTYRKFKEAHNNQFNSTSLADSETETEDKKTTNSEGDDNIMNDYSSKNIILYGPPGTGKTYNTVYYAISLIEKGNADENSINDIKNTYKTYENALRKYNCYKKAGLISFTTFHQSYSYEEFIEGIKPETEKNNNVDNTEKLVYKKEKGMFRAFCEQARNKDVFPNTTDSKVWCILLDGTGESEVKKRCFEEGTIRIQWNGSPKTITEETDGLTDDAKRILCYFQNDMKPGDIVVVERSNKTIDGIGIIDGDYEFDEGDNWPRKRKVLWLCTGQEMNITDLNGGTQLDRNTVYPLWRVSAESILSLVKKTYNKKYVFIIDEINRGNISKIFGELITLIEDSKREGAKETMSVKLPYTGDEFSVPNNIYILGTMNTADRSIALIDTALRRRFQFIEMMPEPDILEKDDKNTELIIKGINIKEMLEAINDRIEVLYDREHTIGHAYFCKLKDKDLSEDGRMSLLANIFRNKIIPLLQEYFYDDYEKIRLVLADNQTDELKHQFITETKTAGTGLFGPCKDYDDESVYAINDKKSKDGDLSAFERPESYTKIYDTVKKK